MSNPALAVTVYTYVEVRDEIDYKPLGRIPAVRYSRSSPDKGISYKTLEFPGVALLLVSFSQFKQCMFCMLGALNLYNVWRFAHIST